MGLLYTSWCRTTKVNQGALMTLGEQIHNTPQVVQLFLLFVGMLCGGSLIGCILWGKYIIVDTKRRIAEASLEIHKKHHEKIKESYVDEVNFYKKLAAYEYTRGKLIEAEYDQRNREIHQMLSKALRDKSN
jgi:hypothetical protein